MPFKRIGDIWTLIFVLIILAMGVEILYLMVQNRKLSSIIEDPKKYFNVLSQKEVVPSITAMDINGNEISLRYSSDAPYTLLFWFSSGCEACDDNLIFWKSIYDEFNSEKIRCIGMCVDAPEEAKEFTDQYGLEFPVICARDQYILESYKGNVLPQTVLISPVGTVLGVWPGALEKGQQGKITALLRQFQPQNLKGGENL